MAQDDKTDGGRLGLARVQDELERLARRRLLEPLSEAEIERYIALADIERDLINSIRSILGPNPSGVDQGRPALVLVGGGAAAGS